MEMEREKEIKIVADDSKIITYQLIETSTVSREEVDVIAFLICLASIILEAIINPKTLVEQAPYIPIKGIPKLEAA